MSKWKQKWPEKKKNTDNKDYLLRNVKWECFAL